METIRFDVEKRFDWAPAITERLGELLRMFGVSVNRLRESICVHKLNLQLADGDICYITGASGAGKTVLLNEMYGLAPAGERIRLDEIALESDKSLIDCVEGGLFDAVSLLSKAGLAEVFALAQSPAALSDGQQYRYRLARALLSEKKYVFADEFCSRLDRISAAVISHNIRKLADAKKDRVFVLASAHDDLLVDLAPDVVVIKYLSGKTEVIYKDRRRSSEF